MKAAKKLSKMETRVVLAKDVLSQLKRGLIKPMTGDYLRGTARDRITSGGMKKEQVQSFIASRPCQACAQGSMFLAYVRRFDGVDSSGFLNEENNLGGNAHGSVLRKIFPREMLSDMEAIYEGYVWRNYAFIQNAQKARPFVDLKPRERLVLMMKNLVKSGGESIYPKGDNKKPVK